MIDAMKADIQTTHEIFTNVETQQLAETKKSLVEKENEVGQLRIQLGKLRQQLLNEEEKKSKSIQLLKNAKIKIQNLESQISFKENTISQQSSKISQFSYEISSKDLELAQLMSQLIQIEKVKKTSIQDSGGRVDSQGFQSLKRDLEKISLEAESVKSINLKLKQEISNWTLETENYKIKLDNLEGDLEISRNLFQNKSSENETLKLKISKLEVESFNMMEKGKMENQVKNQDKILHLKKENNSLKSEIQSLNHSLNNSSKIAERHMKELQSELLDLTQFKEKFAEKFADLEKEKHENFLGYEREKVHFFKLS